MPWTSTYSVFTIAKWAFAFYERQIKHVRYFGTFWHSCSTLFRNRFLDAFLRQFLFRYNAETRKAFDRQKRYNAETRIWTILGCQNHAYRVRGAHFLGFWTILKHLNAYCKKFRDDLFRRLKHLNPYLGRDRKKNQIPGSTGNGVTARSTNPD